MSALSPFQAQAKLASLPASPEAVNYLMSLVNGANSEIPRYMALGRLEQMKQEMASNKPAQPPQGTVKDKIQQAVGIMALRGGQQQQAAQQMAQGAPQGMPVPANVPQPQTQPQSEEEQMPEMDIETAAGGGLMQARVDPRMFDFAPGGIVSFAGDEQSYVDLDKIKAEAEEASNKLRTYGLRQRKEDPEGYDEAVRKAEEAKAAMRAKERELTGGPAGVMRQSMGAGIASLPKEKPQLQGPRVLTGDAAAEQDRLAKAREAFNAPPVAAPPPPPVAAAPAAAAPRPAAAPAAPRPPVAAAPGLDQGVGALAQKLTPEVDESKLRAAYGKAAPTTRSIEEIAAEQAKIQELTGVGTYGKNRREQIANMRQEFEQSRPSTSEDVIDMIRAGIRPGAIAGAAGEYSSQLKREREARLSFSKAEDALKDAVEKVDEAVRSGKATDIVRARDEERKAQADYKKAEVDLEKSIMTSKATASGQGLQAAASLMGQKMSSDATVRAAQIRAEVDRLQINRSTERERLINELDGVFKAAEASKPGSGSAAVEARLERIRQASESLLGARFTGPDTSPKDSKAVEDIITKRTALIDTRLQSGNLKPQEEADLLARRKRIADQVRKDMKVEGGGGEAQRVTTQEEYNNLPKGTRFIAPDGSTRVKP